MKINGKDLADYNARLVSWRLSSAEITHNSEWNSGAMIPTIASDVFAKYKTLAFSVEFKGNRDITEKNKSYFLGNLIGGFYLEGNEKSELNKTAAITDYKKESSDFMLTGILESHEVSEENGHFQVVDYVMKVIEEQKPITVTNNGTVNEDFIFHNPGSGVTVGRLEVTPETDGKANVTFNPGWNWDSMMTSPETTHFEFENLRAGETRILDITEGVYEGKTHEEKVNKFKDTHFISFPKIKPGYNRVRLWGINISLKIIFKPRYI